MANLLFYYTQDHRRGHGERNLANLLETEGLGGSDFHTYRFGMPAAYNAPNVVTDLDTILADYRPEDIYTTSEFDGHADHMATYAFVRQALVRRRLADPSYAPELHKTMVWSVEGWPAPIDPTRDHIAIPGLTEMTGLPVERTRERAGAAVHAIDRSGDESRSIGQSMLTSATTTFLQSFVHRDEVFWLDERTGVNHTPTASALAPVVAAPGGEVSWMGPGAPMPTATCSPTPGLRLPAPR